MYDLLQKAFDDGEQYENGHLVNSLVMILRKVPQKTIEIMEEGVNEAAPKFRYFGMDPSMKIIPTATHTLPTGGAMRMLGACVTIISPVKLSSPLAVVIVTSTPSSLNYPYAYALRRFDPRALLVKCLIDPSTITFLSLLLTHIPVVTHTPALLLSQRKAVGVEKIRDMCLMEKKRDDHKVHPHHPRPLHLP